MQSDSEIFAEWLKPEGYTPKGKKQRAKKIPLYLNRELAMPQGIADGISVGGKQASNWRGKIGHRLTDATITSDCVVTTRNGDVYTLRRRSSKTSTKIEGTNLALNYETLQRIAGTIGNVE